jgi:branched-chain amino acid transport system substrate-binding protein
LKTFRITYGIILAAIVITMIPLMAACSQGNTGAAKTLKIGMITSVTGPMAPAFKPMLDATKPIEDLFNNKGGIDVGGQKYMIQIVSEDDKSSPPDAVSAANMLIGEGIKFIIAPMFLASNIAIGQTTEQAKAIRSVAMGIDPTVFGQDNYYHIDALATFYQIGPVYDYLKQNYPQVKKIAIIPPDDPGIVFARDYGPKEAQKRGYEIVFHEPYAVDTTDFYPIVTKALAQKPDAIDCITSILPWGAGIINSARDQGFKGPIFAPCMFGDINILNSMIKPEYAYDIFCGGPDVLSDKMPDLVKELRPLVEQQTGGPLNMDNVNTLQALWPMIQGIEKAQSLDTDKVMKALEGMDTVQIAWGQGTWAGEDVGVLNHLVKMTDIPLTRIMNGKLEFSYLK